jgi:hypothetical protein
MKGQGCGGNYTPMTTVAFIFTDNDSSGSAVSEEEFKILYSFIQSLGTKYFGRVTTLSSGRAMAQIISRRSLTAEYRLRARVNHCGIYHH